MQMASTRNERSHCYGYYNIQRNKKTLWIILLKLFLKIEKEETFPNSSYEAGIALIIKPGKIITRKEHYSQYPSWIWMQQFLYYWQMKFNIIYHDQVVYLRNARLV